MLKIKLDKVIPTIVETMLPRFTDSKIGLMITLDLRDDFYSNKDDENDKSAASIMQFIFHRPNNYTRVLVDYKFNNFYDDHHKVFIEGQRYKQTSNHDSAWRVDGLLILNRHFENVENYFNMSSNKISSFYTFSMSNLISYIEFEKMKEIKKDNSFPKFYNVKIRRKVPLSEIHEYLPKL